MNKNQESSERRLEQYRQHHRRKIASMTPEELAQHRAAKAAYDREYRLRNAEERKAHREAYKARQNEIRREKYRLMRASPRIIKTEEEKKERRQAYWKKRFAANPNVNKPYYATHQAEILEQKRTYYQANRKEIIRKQNKRVAADPRLRSLRAIYVRISRFIRRPSRSLTTMNLLGCDRVTFLKWIESQFTEGMSWDNYGRNGWHLDHKHPVSKFDHADPEQLAKCWHYTNLQPMWAIDNIRKSNKIN